MGSYVVRVKQQSELALELFAAILFRRRFGYLFDYIRTILLLMSRRRMTYMLNRIQLLLELPPRLDPIQIPQLL